MEFVQNVPFFCIMVSMFSGTVSSVLPGKWARRLNAAMVSLVAVLSGWLLEGIGYSSEAASSGLTQSQTVLDGIFSISTLVPALGFVLLALVLWFWYPLHKKQVDANVAALKEKHGR